MFAVSSLPALAVTNTNAVTSSTPYVAAFAPAFGGGAVPFSGTMRLAIAPDGSISGSYTGTSVRPDPLDNRITPISGAIDTSDGQMQFDVGNALSFVGTMNSDGSISGTAQYGGGLYAFVAKPGTPGGR